MQKIYIVISLGRLLTISSACALSPVVGLDGVAHAIWKHQDKKEDNVRIETSRHCVEGGLWYEAWGGWASTSGHTGHRTGGRQLTIGWKWEIAVSLCSLYRLWPPACLSASLLVLDVMLSGTGSELKEFSSKLLNSSTAPNRRTV